MALAGVHLRKRVLRPLDGVPRVVPEREKDRRGNGPACRVEQRAPSGWSMQSQNIQTWTKEKVWTKEQKLRANSSTFGLFKCLDGLIMNTNTFSTFVSELNFLRA